MRILEHGMHPVLSEHPLFQGCNLPRADNLWASARGQLLIEVEFLLRHGGQSPTCVYTQAPPHVKLVAQLFPDVMFVGYGREEEYDPTAPGISNLTLRGEEFTSASGREWGMRGPSHPVLLIGGQGERHLRQLIHHALVRPMFSLLALSEVPEDFLSGELRLPIHTSFASPLVYLIAPGHACGRLYFPSHLLDELAHHQVVCRAGEGYDEKVEEQILDAYSLRAGIHRDVVRGLLPPEQG